MVSHVFWATHVDRLCGVRGGRSSRNHSGAGVALMRRHLLESPEEISGFAVGATA